ncbi:hypothetical protein PISL3812_03311 [Talaromyces islandicus]|uniref:Uncharacterized protein n=1 Tax=Talaromyces islandicus TaxID=28573 RepID=A0A0U1LU55_TALIS|nr:hypothetical protein PISL3812_03311 [Talaromyces islandicus]
MPSPYPPPSGTRKRTESNPKHQQISYEKGRKPRGGRPLLSFADLESRKNARLAKRRWKEPGEEEEHEERNATGTPRLRRHGTSLLEQLPVEIIEKVFLYALDTNLCRASPYIAAAVSSERIYRTLIRLAFWDDGISGSSLPLQNADVRNWLEKTLQPADYTMRLGDAERVHLQATVLRCKWCTKDRLEAQLPTLMHMAIQRHWFGAGIAMSDPADQASLDRFLSKKEDSKLYEGVLSSPPSSAANNNNHDNNNNTYYMSIIPLVSVSINCAEKNIRQVHRVLNLRVLPDHLLRGNKTTGFSDSTIDLLETFRRAYGFDGTGHDVTFSRAVLQQGIRNAVLTQNGRALTTLLKIDEFFMRRRLETSSTTTSSSTEYYVLPAEHFVTAAKLQPARDAIELFKLLLRCNAESVPPDSAEVTQWAMELSEGRQGPQNVGFGRWLLDFMVELPRHIDGARQRPREEALFYYGAVNVHSRAGRQFLDEVCPGALPGEWQQTWIQKMSFDISKTWLLPNVDIQE